MSPSQLPAEKLTVETAISWLRQHAPQAMLTADSRRVRAGDVFFGYAPSKGVADGRHYIGDAIARGAAAVLFDSENFDWESAVAATQPAALSLPHLGCLHLCDIAGLIANAHYAQPDAAMFSVAVTGTNGKTSCTQWLGEAISRGGAATAVIGTFGTGIFRQGKRGDFTITGYTTPDALQLQATLVAAKAQGAEALAIEASSIGLQQGRMRGMHVDVAVLTNLTRDHLDFHGDMKTYEAAKSSLFDWPGLKHAIINLDDPMGPRLVAHLRHSAPSVRLIGYTVKADVDAGAIGLCGPGALCLRASELRSTHSGTQFMLRVDELSNAKESTLVSATAAATTPTTPTTATVRTPATLVKTQLVGDFNVSNVLAVLGVLLVRAMPLPLAITAVAALTPVAGRMQQIGGPEQPLVVIDYAHTPDALEKTLASLRRLAQERQGELWCVFGCGGDRDPGKRAQMGAISAAADHVVVTSDNPRNEAPAAIIADIVAGIAAPATAQVIEDRAAAILWALRHAAKADVVLLAGKGHENYQEIKGRKQQFLDADHAALALAARVTMRGPG